MCLCQFLPLFIEKEIEGENVLAEKQSLSLLCFGYRPSTTEILGGWLKIHTVF